MKTAIRTALSALAALQLTLGVWTSFFPRSFYNLPVIWLSWRAIGRSVT